MTTYSKNELLKMNVRAKFPYLIKITHYKNDNTSEVYRYSNTDEDIVYEGETYTGSCFAITPSQKNNEGVSDAKISISAIDQEWIEKIRNTSKRAKIEFIATIMTDSTIEPIDDIEYDLSTATWDDSVIQWNMEFDNLADILVPCDEFNSLSCPQVG